MTDAAHTDANSSHVDQFLLAAPVPPPQPNYNGTERRSDSDVNAWRDHVNARLDAGARKMDAMQKELQANTVATQAVQSDTSELVSLLSSFKGFFRVFELLGKLAKPLSAIVGLIVAGVAGYHAFFNGGGPHK